MKKPERLVGFVTHDDIEFPFEYNESSYELALYPPSQKVRYEKSNPFGFSSSHDYDVRKHEWIKNKRISGTTSAGYNIIFDVQDLPSNYQGFISYQVNWFFCFEIEQTCESISGFKATGNDVNFFYPPQNALSSHVQFKNDGQSVDKMTVSSSEYKSEPCGQYRIRENIDASITVSAYSTLHFNNWANPIDSTSTLTTMFSVPVGIDTLLEAYYLTKQFFEFIAHRHNIILGDIEIIYKDDQGRDRNSGVLVFPVRHEAEKNEDAAKKIVQYHILTTKTSDLITYIKNDSIGLEFLCDSIDSTSWYPASRIIMILAEFERAFWVIYGQDSGRSPKFLSIKQSILDLIEEYENKQSGKARKYAKEIKTFVQKLDNNYEERLKTALKDYVDILCIFIEKKYVGVYDHVVAEISKRMGVIRNGIAHSKIDINFDAIHLCDIKIVEELIYALWLKKIGLANDTIQKAINSLFGEGFPM